MKDIKLLASSIVGMLVMFVFMATTSITTMTANIFTVSVYAEEKTENKYPIIPLSTNSNPIASLGLSEENRGNNSGADSKFLTHTNETYGISIQYPQDWTIKDNYRLNPDDPYITVASFFAPPGENLTLPREEVSVYIDTKQYKTTLEDYLEQPVILNNNTLAGGWENLQIIKAEQNSTLAERTAYKVALTYKDQISGGSIDRYLLDTGTPIEDKMYVISYWAHPQTYSKQQPTVQKMIDSFEILVEGTIDSEPPSLGQPNIQQPTSLAISPQQ
jgi:hypothetical protein